MPRILPWKRHEEEAHQHSKSSRSVARTARPDEVDSASPSDTGEQSRKKLKRSRRSGSASAPPPAPLREIFMIEGVENDDRHRMVEDELLATAQLFTAHLHAAEYQRLGEVSELVENTQMIKNISRPVVGRTTDMVKTKAERKLLKEKQQRGIQKFRKGNASGDESTESDDPMESWQMQSLHGLMESQGSQDTQLNGLQTATSMTRAAAGYSRQARDNNRGSSKQPKLKAPSDTEDDLDAPSTYCQTNPISQAMSRSSSMAEARRPLFSRSCSAMDISQSQQQSQQATKDQVVTDNDDDDEEMDFMARLKKRREERRQSRGHRQSIKNNNAKLDSKDVLPDFL